MAALAFSYLVQSDEEFGFPLNGPFLKPLAGSKIQMSHFVDIRISILAIQHMIVKDQESGSYCRQERGLET